MKISKASIDFLLHVLINNNVNLTFIGSFNVLRSFDVLNLITSIINSNYISDWYSCQAFGRKILEKNVIERKITFPNIF